MHPHSYFPDLPTDGSGENFGPDIAALRGSVDPVVFDRFVAAAVDTAANENEFGHLLPDTNTAIRAAASEARSAYADGLRGQAELAAHLSALGTSPHGQDALRALADLADANGHDIQSNTLRGLIDHSESLVKLTALTNNAANNVARMNPKVWLDDSEFAFPDANKVGRLTRSLATNFGKDLFVSTSRNAAAFPGLRQAGTGLSAATHMVDKSIVVGKDKMRHEAELLTQAKHHINQASLQKEQLKVAGSHAKLAAKFAALAEYDVAHRALRGLVRRVSQADSTFDGPIRAGLSYTLAGLASDPKGWASLRKNVVDHYVDRRLVTTRTSREALSAAQAANAATQATTSGKDSHVEYNFGGIDDVAKQLRKVGKKAKALLHRGKASKKALESSWTGASSLSFQQVFDQFAATNERVITVTEQAVQNLDTASQGMQQLDQAMAARMNI